MLSVRVNVRLEPLYTFGQTQQVHLTIWLPCQRQYCRTEEHTLVVRMSGHDQYTFALSKAYAIYQLDAVRKPIEYQAIHAEAYQQVYQSDE